MGIVTAVAMNFQIEPTSSGAYRLLPVGAIKGRDGRGWTMGKPEAVIAWCKQNGRDIPVDLEHSTEHKAPKGDPAPAVGWISPDSLRVEDDHLVGDVAFNREDNPVANKEYRYLSPVFIYDQKTREVIGLTSIGLTNQPNLYLPALNAADYPAEDAVMDKDLLAALGLPETADNAAALAAVNALKSDKATALNQVQNPPLDKFVPRADYDTVLNRATTAETSLAQQQQTQAATAIETAINAALQAGKITPATVEYHKAQCRTDGGLERFNQFVSAAPVIASASGLDGKAPDGAGVALNSEEREVCKLLGITEADFIKTKQETA